MTNKKQSHNVDIHRFPSEEVPDLVLVMPAYRQESTIIEDIRRITVALDEINLLYRLIIVVDGIVDETYKRASSIRHPRIRVVAYETNRGKGHAILYGLNQQDGRVKGFIDAGMDISIESLIQAIQLQRSSQADIVIGSKRHPASRVNYPFLRKIYSITYQVFTRILFRLNVRDTQVGVKLFRKDVFDSVAPCLLVKRYAFDIELLAVAYAFGFSTIIESPVDIRHVQFKSSVNLRAIVEMIWDSLAVWYRLRIRQYYQKIRHSTN